jgi:coniferyl-aldehyde dehydrogenase
VDNDDYTAIISDRYYGRLQALIDDARAKGADIRTVNHDDVDTGKRDRRFPFTIVIGAHDDMAVMQEEIFGPILPIIASDSLEHSLRFIRSRPHPLAAYYFGTDNAEIGLVTSGIQTGSIVINDALCQIFHEQIPFGGVGASGMGRYRGHEGFKTFSNSVSVFTQRSDEAVLASQRPPFGPDVAAYFNSQIEALRRNDA